MDLYEFMQESNARARRGRRLAREMILGAVVILAIPAFLFIAQPNFTNSGYDPRPLGLIIPAIGVVGLGGGLIWMVRIFRADPEPDAKGWRYRD